MIELGRGGSEVAHVLGWPRRAGVVVLAAFSGNVLSAMLRAGAAASGHHGCALTAVVERWIGFAAEIPPVDRYVGGSVITAGFIRKRSRSDA